MCPILAFTFLSPIFHGITLDDARRLDVLESHGPALKKEFGAENYEKFRMFYLMSAEAFGSAGGCRYMIGYYVLKPTRPT
jgi:hypothetical protein